MNAAKKWGMVGLKVRQGVGGMVRTKRRDVKDAETFIVKESEVMIVLPKTFESYFLYFQEACKEDQLDLEGKCLRKKADKRYFRRSGVCVGSTQGRDCAW